jgi:hypothetical protein
MSINDIRRLENMNTVEGGDSYLQPLNFININQADAYYQSQMQNSDKTKALAEEIYKILDKKGKEG